VNISALQEKMANAFTQNQLHPPKVQLYSTRPKSTKGLPPPNIQLHPALPSRTFSPGTALAIVLPCAGHVWETCSVEGVRKNVRWFE